jgi:hypothetical protein
MDRRRKDRSWTVGKCRKGRNSKAHHSPGHSILVFNSAVLFLLGKNDTEE